MVINIVLKVLLALVAMFCCMPTCSALNCYSCTGIIGTPVGDACATMSIGNYTTGHNFCTTTSDGVTVQRSGGFPGINANSTYGCNAMQDRCTCDENLCNNQALVKTTTKCYVCASVPVFNNGCGNDEYWNPESKYVHEETGCSACSKTTNSDSVTRGCLHSIHQLSQCVTSLNGGTSCSCFGDHCNHASSLFRARDVYFVIGVSFVLKFWK